MMRLAMAAAILIGMAVPGGPAQAQTKTAYQVGRDVAAQRGVANPDCYARVFARHANRVEYANGSRGWNAQSTPAYNNDLKRTCGVDRLAIIRGGQPAAASRAVANQPRTAVSGGGGAYQAGLNLAAQRGYANRACFARWYARKASPMPDGRYAIWSYHHDRSDLWSECRIAM